jgi:hypothetical protein
MGRDTGERFRSLIENSYLVSALRNLGSSQETQYNRSDVEI